MKTKVKVLEKVTQPVEVEVEFPIYREHDISGHGYSAVIYSRITSDMKEFSIQENDDGFELEFSKVNFLDGSPADYWLGRGLHASTQEDFEAAHARAQAFLASAFTKPE